MPDTDTIDPRREELEFEEHPESDYPSVLVDPVLKQRLRLDRTGYQIASLLDRPQTLAELSSRLQEKHNRSVKLDTLTRVIDFFDSYRLLDNERSRQFRADLLARREAARDLDRVPLLFRPQDRFSCVLCGSCCGGHNVGPVSEDVVTSIREKTSDGKLHEELGLNKSLFFSVSLEDEEDEMVVTQMREGWCVFLTNANRCILHGKWGAECKPDVCRIFPFTFTRTPRGVVVGFQMECRGFAEAKRRGRPLAEEEQSIRKLLKRLPKIAELRPVLPLADSASLSFEEYERLEQSVLGTIDRGARENAQLLDTITAVGALLDEKRDSSSERPSEEELRAQLSAFVESLGSELKALYDKHVKEEPTIKLLTHGLDHFCLALQEMQKLLGLTLEPIQDETIIEYLHDVYAQYFYAKDITCYKTLRYGHALFAFRYILSLTLAVVRNTQVGRRHLVLQDVIDSTAIFGNLFRNQVVQKVLLQSSDTITHLFHSCFDLLVRWSKPLSHIDQRHEFFMF